ncbi:uncharacterized protein Z520_12175 [Fonsecaea multimorphosa CBS 102226]|uniref:Aminoglycoside phosphotransferase domain-containing protein n=1 Tax=Fonsecaea multimorphosa CBS 102226 TaxID=1442371 RepID=A0A0D2I448_9EURO|nr:uncharacterized protein Z520_12175 [Fonsecaea multimorphosa CBS 102226]KIX92091.1 hypothetical protein Z520_12175 [Fonsecaea multimorphosa CBS 102226]OAL17455.1 hypothetical protein AYO22_11587 [Fonsecaea multimorphosa]
MAMMEARSLASRIVMLVLLPATLLLQFCRQSSHLFRRPSCPRTLKPEVTQAQPFSISIPYYASATELPARLPTTKDIERSRGVLSERLTAKVVTVGPHFVVKYGKGIDLEEGRMMMFVQSRARMPVPRVYAIYHDRGKNFIVMERVNGQTLHALWPNLTASEKKLIANQLGECLRRMRAVQSPNGFCSLDDIPLRDGLFWSGHGDQLPGLGGPFATEMELNNAIIKKCQAIKAIEGKASFYQESLPLVFRDHPPTLTHGDLQPKNIMVRAKPKSGLEIVLLDWEFAGWYPSYWEYSQAIMACGWFEDDWHHWVGKFLDPYPSEYAWLLMLENEIGW